MSDERAGVVLAGGFSTRFGDRDKALAPVDGDPMLARVVDRLNQAVDEVVVSCRRAQRDEFERVLADRRATVDRYAVDPTPDCGPLVGLRTALERVGAPAVAVVACDMPWVDPAVLSALFDRLAGYDGVVPAPSDRLQPAHAVYRTAPLWEAVKRQVATEDRSLCGAVDRLDVVAPSASGRSDLDLRRSLRDVNERGDLLEGSHRFKNGGDSISN
jgi:molybdopterin-guanine dinucleotide biosynthesis protein A